MGASARLSLRAVCRASAARGAACPTGATPASATQPRHGVSLMLNGFGIHPAAVRTWNSSEHRICADGGLAKVLQMRGSMASPTHVIGDLDSLRTTGATPPEGCHVIENHCQDTTDFMKCIAFIEEELRYSGDVVTGFALGGRIDHEQANFRVLLTTQRCRPILMGQDIAVCPLHPGITIIEAGAPMCSPVGLIPLLGPTTVTTTGLRWNLESAAIGYGAGLRWTSSNEFLPGQDVTVTSDKSLLWTAALQVEDGGDRVPGEGSREGGSWRLH